jgi:DNA replication and repair protein RecF
VTFGSRELTLFCTSDDGGVSCPVGIVKHLGKGTDIKINGSPAKSASQLARVLPLLVVDGASFSFLDGSSKYRRSLLDWLLFHVEHEFLGCFKNYRLALKQRNALLRRGTMSGSELEAWSVKVATYGDQLTHFREAIFSDFTNELSELAAEFELDLFCELYKGWKSDESLGELLSECPEADVKAQTTTMGAHRADMLFTHKNLKLAEIFSRGQKKRLLLLVYLAILKLYQAKTKRLPILALDDFPAELDPQSQQRLLDKLLALGGQVVITAIEGEGVLSCTPETIEKKVFHVKHGEIYEYEITE